MAYMIVHNLNHMPSACPVSTPLLWSLKINKIFFPTIYPLQAITVTAQCEMMYKDGEEGSLI